MILRNYYAFLGRAIIGDNVIDPECLKVQSITGNRMSSSGILAQKYSTATYLSLLSKTVPDNQIRLGVEITQPTFEDSKLENDITNSLVSSNVIVETVGDVGENCSATRRIKHQYINNSGESITITEVGVGRSITLNSSIYTFLISRDILAEPITVPNGQGITVTVDLTFNGFEVLSSASAE